MKNVFKFIGYFLLMLIVSLTAAFFVYNDKCLMDMKGEKADFFRHENK